MDAQTVVNQVLTVSGRWDLMPPSFQEGGSQQTAPLVTALDYINSGIDLLEQLCPNENQCLFFLPVDQIIVIPRGRYIRKLFVGSPEVWALMPRSTYERIPIFSAIRTQHLPIDLVSGRYMDVLPDDVGLNHIAYKMFFGTGGQCVKITGAFHPEPLQAPTDTNYWCTKHPLLVTYATLYRIETAYRNREGAAAWLDSVNRDIRMIDYDQSFDQVPEGFNYG